MAMELIAYTSFIQQQWLFKKHQGESPMPNMFITFTYQCGDIKESLVMM